MHGGDEVVGSGASCGAPRCRVDAFLLVVVVVVGMLLVSCVVQWARIGRIGRLGLWGGWRAWVVINRGGVP